MKKTIKLFLLTAIFTAISLALSNLSYAAISVYDEDTLNNEIQSADPGETIELENDITVTKPIVIAKELTIDGNGHNIVGSNEWTSTSGNQTMFTAQFSDAKLTLKNINLKNGPKYGVQSYDGATVILDNVFITGFKYGGVLANGGNVEVINLHLGKNGENENNGIEIDKGASATNNPSLTMNGTLITDSNENVIRPAENGYLTEFTITNSPNTTNKVILSGSKVVLTDSENNVISESSIPAKATPNVDTKKIIISIIANDLTYKIAVDSGTKLTSEILTSPIKLEENQKVDGFFTDSAFTTEFNFENPLTSDTTIYTKISVIEESNPTPTPVPEVTPEPTPEQQVIEEKDETPKTGVETYFAEIILSIIFIIALVAIFKFRKNTKG